MSALENCRRMLILSAAERMILFQRPRLPSEEEFQKFHQLKKHYLIKQEIITSVLCNNSRTSDKKNYITNCHQLEIKAKNCQDLFILQMETDNIKHIMLQQSQKSKSLRQGLLVLTTSCVNYWTKWFLNRLLLHGKTGSSVQRGFLSLISSTLQENSPKWHPSPLFPALRALLFSLSNLHNSPS